MAVIPPPIHDIASVLDGGRDTTAGTEQAVHVVAPEVYVWSDDHQKIEYLITSNSV